MFKIPSYNELEKKEKEINAKNSELKLDLFKKQKELNKIEELHLNSKEDVDEDEDDDLIRNFDLNAVTMKKQAVTDKQAQVPRNIDNIQPSVSKQVPDEQFKKPKPSTIEHINSNINSVNSLLVNSKQRGNPILKHIRNVPWHYSDTLTPDYSMSRSSCALYLSMKYHLLNNEYIHQRLKELGRAYELRILLVLVDIKETKHCLKELEKICLLANLTLILCWSYEEAGRYLEIYKAYEHKSADIIMERIPQNTNLDTNFMNNYTEFLCAIKSINKTDASTLRQTFGSLKQLSEAEKHELSICPGLGPLKVNRLYEIFRTPFLLDKK